MIAQVPNLNAILKRHEIHPKFWPDIRAFLEEGVVPDEKLMTRLRRVANYKAAISDAVHEIGNEHTFPPAGYQSPVPYESLRAEDIEHVVEFEDFEAFQAMDTKQPTRCEKCRKKKARRILVKPPKAHNQYEDGHPRKGRGRG